jgi:hypothetical protein
VKIWELDELLKISIVELRNIAREYKAEVLSMTRDELICLILVNNNGGTFVNVYSVGKPRQETAVRMDNYFNSVPVSGFVFVVARGVGVLISRALNTYAIPIKFVTDYELLTGDFIEALMDGNTMKEIIKVDPLPRGKPVRPTREAELFGEKIKFGQRIIAKAANNQDALDRAAKSEIKGTKYALLIDETEDCVDFLVQHGFAEVFVTKVDFSLKKKVILAVSALMRAKAKAAEGHDVVLFIENLNRLFRLYNSTVFETNAADMTQVAIGPLADLKSLFMEARQIEGGGSLTIVEFMKEPQTENERFVLAEICDLANYIIQLK